MNRFRVCALVLGVGSVSAACGSDNASPAGPTEGPGGTTSGTTGAGGSSATGSGGSTGTAGGGTGGSQSGTGGSTGGSGGGGGSGPMPDGNSGIAAKHPGDVGIATDPAVIFADDFESYAKPADLNKRGDAVYQNQNVTIPTDPKNIYAGKQALEFTPPQH